MNDKILVCILVALLILGATAFVFVLKGKSTTGAIITKFESAPDFEKCYTLGSKTFCKIGEISVESGEVSIENFSIKQRE